MNDITTTVIGVLAEALPDGRSLTIAECADAAQAAAAVYDLDALVDFELGERTYTQLWRTAYSEAYAIGWKQAGDTGFHDHDGSVGAVHVVRGTVAEEHIVLRPAGDWLARVEFAAGETFRFDGAHIHRMRHAAGRHGADGARVLAAARPRRCLRALVRRHATPPQHGRRRGAARERHVQGAPRRRGSAARCAGVGRALASALYHRGVVVPLAPWSRSSTHTGGSPLSSLQIRISAVPTGSVGSRCASSPSSTRACGSPAASCPQAEGVVAAGIDDVEAGQRERLERRVVLAGPVAGELAHPLGHVGCERDQLARRPAGAMTGLGACGLLEDRRRPAPTRAARRRRGRARPWRRAARG